VDYPIFNGKGLRLPEFYEIMREKSAAEGFIERKHP
jgi:hypothetical protein